MQPRFYDADAPDFVNRAMRSHAIAYSDECAQLYHQAEDDYCKLSAALSSPENDARYELSKRHMHVARGLYAEAADAVNSYRYQFEGQN